MSVAEVQSLEEDRLAEPDLPLSYGQRALWFLERLAPGNAAYVIAGGAKVLGTIEPAALQRAALALAARHPALRTTFHETAAGPVQRVGEEPRVDFVAADGRGLDDSGIAARLSALAFAPFDLAKGPLWRLVLLRLDDPDGGFALALAIHHIVSDFWSLAVLLRDLGEAYGAPPTGGGATGSLGSPSSMEVATGAFVAPPPVGGALSQVVRREEELLAGPEGERLWELWREALAGFPTALELPTDRPRPPVQTYAGASLAFHLPAADLDALRRLSRKRGATLYMALLAAYNVLLSRWTGQEKLLVGCPTTGRGEGGLAGVVGYLVNPVAIPGDLTGDPDFAALLARVKGAALAAFAHQRYPFPLLAERLQPERDPGRSPLFQALLVLQKGRKAGEEGIAAFSVGEPGARIDLGPFALESLALPEPGAQFDLSLGLAEVGGRLAGRLVYNRDLFERETASRLAGHFGNLLSGLAAEPELLSRRIPELPLLGKAEREQLLSGWNETGPAPFPGLCLHELFFRQAAAQPDATALVSGDRRLSYGELAERAGRLAGRLTEMGVGPEGRVGICARRTEALVAGMFAILRAGGAYVPLDPAYLRERLALMLADSGAEILLAEAELEGLFPADGVRVLRLEEAGQASRAWPETGLRAGNLAYLIYTSGSTGRPKAVAIEHRSAAARVGWAAGVFSASELSGVLAATSICFDLSVFELFVPLSLGGTVHLADNALALPEIPSASAVTLVNTVPSAMAELVRAGALPASVRTVNLAGEPLHGSLAAAVHAAGVPRLLNLYGPSEDTTYSTLCEVAPGPGEPTLGRPIAGSRAYVAGRHGEPVPVGVPGELLLGGAGLARGYLGRPELTAEKFVPDPWSGEAGGRLYRTGDLVRRRAGGDLVFLGRIDHLVKVRGFRVELGEIEAALRTLPGVREALVLALDRPGGDRQLVAYVTGEGLAPAAPADAESLAAALAARLPAYMVPGAFAFLDSLPLSLNGKVDRQALARIEPGRVAGPAGRAPYVPPSGPVEELVAGIWAEVLGLPRVGTQDDFFRLGGHSLQAAQVASRLRDACGVEIPLRQLFVAPTVAALAAVASAALGGARPAAPALPPLPRPADGQGLSPLSPAQERLWFLDRLAPGSAHYNLAGAVRLAGRLDVAALAAALSAIVARHEALRTTVRSDARGPAQAVAPAAPLPLPLVDLAALPAVLREEEARRLAAGEAARSFDLATGPLVRAALLSLSAAAAGEHVLLLTLHHIVADGWSLGVLVRELTAFYAAARSGAPAALAPLPLQYREYALRQRRALASPRLAGQLAWWQRQLAGAPELLELPADRPRPAVASFRGGAVPVVLPGELADRLAALAERRQATLFMVLLAGFAALLSRLSGSDDLVVGAPVANRPQRELEGLIGLFVNTLPLRADLSGAPALADLLDRVREATLGAYAHQEVPFEALVRELAPERGLGASPLFQVVLAFQNAPAPPLALPGLLLEPLPPPEGTAKFDLTLALFPGRAGAPAIRGSLEYSRDLFDRPTAQRFAAAFVRLLERAAAEPARPLAELPLLAASERQQILVEWAGGQAAPAGFAASLPARFASQVAERPDAVALTAGAERLSYAELARRAHRLARHLRRLGVMPGDRVGLFLDRSPAMVTAILATLEAGAAYVPLDPVYPEERVAFALRDSAVPVVVTESALRGRLQPPPGVVTLCLDGEAAAGIAGESPAPLGLSVGEGDLAYVIYTSGSTGRPKGVGVTHGNVLRLLAATEPWFGFGPGDAWTVFHSYAFDFSVWELWGALAYGGRLVLVSWEVSRSPAAFRELLAAEGVTVLNQTPSAFRQLAGAEEEAVGQGRPALAALRYGVFGGEALEPQSLAPWMEGHGEEQPRLVNMYGITETTVHVTYRPLSRRDLGSPAGGSRIGRPIPDLALYLLDARFQPVPVGVAGEMLVGGAGVAMGYLGRPELTAARFVPDPFVAVPGARLYRSGDLARHRPDGDLEYLGRIDHQVKIRGFRIELGEIEAALVRHPRVRQAAVFVDGKGDEQRLLAAIVPGAPAPPALGPTLADLRSFLAAALPDYMLPAGLVRLAALPLTANGKVDLKALRSLAESAPEDAAMAATAERIAPRTPTEERLARVWSQVLGIAAERVGALDDFFASGGHSLLATRLVSGIRQEFGVELPLKAVFATPTLAGLAAQLGEIPGAPALAPPLQPVPRGGELPLSFAQERLWFLDQLSPGSPFYNLAGAVRLTGALAVPALAWALAGVRARHESLRTCFGQGSLGPVQVVAPAGESPLPLADLSRLPAEARDREARRLAAAEAARPFDLAAGPLVRTGLLRLAAGEHLLLLTLHHIVADGWSMGVLVRELTALYGAAVAGRPADLPPLPVQYPDFAVWQRGWLAGEELDRQLAWWRERLAGAPALLALPTDRPRPAVQGFRGGAVPVVLPAGLADGLAARGREGREGARPTLFMALLGGFSALLARLAGSEDLVVGSPVANRRWAEVEGMIGFFVNTLPLRIDLAGEPPFSDLLDRVRAWTLDAFARQDVAFEKLVEELAPERSLGHSPLFQVVFALQTAPAAPLALPGLALETLPAAEGAAKFDLTLDLIPEGDGVAGSLEYDRDLFDRTTARRMADALVRLLEGAVAHPGARLGELPLLSAGERAQLLAEWNDTRVAPREERLVPERFLDWAERRPTALALAWPGGRLAYGDLAARAGRLARHLRQHLRRHLRHMGVGPELRVAVAAAGHTPERVVGLLAVLLAGGAYVPLDPDAPAERLAFQIADSNAALLLAERRLAGQLPPVETLYLEDAIPEDTAEPPAARPTAPQDLAYVVYTSGSTGVPKGVAVPHAGLANLVRWHQERYGVTPEDRATLVANPAFDASVWELWPYLAAGASVHLPDPEARLAPAALVDAWEREGITLAFLPTPLAESVLAEGRPARPGLALRALLCGGDRLHQAPEPGLSFALWNHYGPSEVSVVTTVAPVPAGLPGLPAIGRPIANLRALVRDAWGALAPLGVSGELAIGGAGLARGYLGRPDLTAERFVPDPWSGVRGEPGARLYRSGDLVRHLQDGSLDFLGRIDHQVKLRGFRIELGEIESVLAAEPGVREAAVLIRALHGDDSPPGDRRLVAYVAGEGRDPEPLRQALARKLPAYMVPGAFVFLDTLPLTRNGKVDRKALAARPAEGGVSAGGAAEAVPPRTPLEARLAAIWADLLGHEVGVFDDFFAAGGHSLLATRLVARVREEIQVEIPLRAVFEAPTIAGIAGIAARIGESAGGALLAPPLRPLPREGEIPLSYAQERLWFLDRLSPGSAAYNIAAALSLDGTLSAAVLAQAFCGLIARHEALRTTFHAGSAGPVQVIGESPAGWTLPLVDLAGLPSEAGERAARRLAREEAARPFDLVAGPLLRATLLRLAPERHLALLTLHHIVADGASMDVLARDLGALYAGTALPPLPVQYADHVLWQRSFLAAGELDRQLAWWRERLAGAPTVLELPADRPRPPALSPRGGAVPLALSDATAPALAAAAHAAGGTLFMALFAGVAAFLSRYTGALDLLVGSPVANRTQREAFDLIGLFVNSLALRAELAGRPRFREVLAGAREMALGAYAHQDLPFERLVEELQPVRDLARSPLFQVLLVLQKDPPGALVLPGLTLAPAGVDTGTAQLDLQITFVETAGRLTGTLTYAADLFDRATAERMAGHLATLLAGAAADPGLSLAGLPLLTPAESAQLAAWNATAAAYPEAGRTLPELVARQAATTPDAVAAVADGAEAGALSYAALAARAATLAGHLRTLGVGPETIVGLCAERSLDMIVALLGIVNAGAAYLPLDPAYPADRLAAMLEDARVPVILAQEHLLDRLPEHSATLLLLGVTPLLSSPHPLPPPRPGGRNPSPGGLRRGEERRPGDGEGGEAGGSGWASLPSLPSLPPRFPDASYRVPPPWAGWRVGMGGGQEGGGPPDPDSLAYVIFTSGSTGRPKGVMNSHRGIVNRILWMQSEYRLTAEDRVLQKTPYSFDVSVWEFFWPLLTGARLVFALPGGHQDSAYLARTLAREGITVTHFVPSMLAAFLAEPDVEDCVSLSRVMASGEALPADLARQLLTRTRTELHNLYGPTEAAVDVTYWACEREPLIAGVPIGRPVSNTAIHLLDPEGVPVPVGVPGELAIGGIQVARGYVRRPELTAERFVPDPFSATPGGRLYRTGDLARRRPGGEIEYLGRLDHQVKLRGLRIELGEIEAVLAAHPAVGVAAVVVREARPGDSRLVAYVSGRGEETPDPATLRAHLAGRLPEYMVPAHFVLLPSLPLTASGKVDRRALPAPVWTARRESAAATSSRTPLEELVALLWADVLGLPDPRAINPDDSFFDLGGHSLLATQVVSRLREATGVELPLRRLFERPTLSGLAAAIEEARAEAGGAAPAPPILPVPRDSELPLSFAQERLWLLDQLEPGSFAYNLPSALLLRGRLDLPAFAASLGEIVRRHESLRTRFVGRPGGPVQEILPSATPATSALFPLPLVDLSALPESRRTGLWRALAEADARRPFDLARGPLLRVALLLLSPEESVLLSALHHIVSDGWSNGIFLRELAALYAAFREGRPSPLPDLPVQVADHAVWQRAWLAGGALERELAWWRSRLAGASTVLELPVDRPRPQVQRFLGAHHPLLLPPPLAAAVRAFCRESGTTLFMTLLAAFQALLSRYTGKRDLLVGSPVAGRTRREVEDLIGFFVNTLILRLDLSGPGGGPGFQTLALRARETALGAYDHQEIPFEKLVEALRPERHLARAPFFQVLFVLQNAPFDTLQLPGLEWTPLPVESGIAKFDLTLGLREAGESLAGNLEYDRDLFDATTAARLAGHFEILLGAALAAPDLPLSELPLLAPAERQQVRIEWNDPLDEYGERGLVPELIAAAVAGRPDALALASATEQVSYGELAARAARLGRHLRATGVGPESRVGIAVERSAAMVVALLGVWEAGGAYLPLSPSLPAERLAFMLADSRAGLVLADRQTAPLLPALGAPVRLVEELEAMEPAAPVPPAPPLHPGQLAYIIYTSGSTGRPKGAAVGHGALGNRMRYMEAHEITPDDLFLQKTTLLFDASVGEIFSPLVAGATLVLASPGEESDPERLIQRIALHGVTRSSFTPSLLHALLLGGSLARCPSLQGVKTGGEAMTPELVSLFYSRSTADLYNRYGPTEATISVTSWHCRPGEAGRVVPIGRPIAKTEMYLADPDGALLPAGVPGELWLGGPNLARGYQERPDLTAEKFVPHPWAERPGERLYRTGDLVRFRPDGAAEFVGRIDGQVKIRGYRVELGEIEAALAEHPAVAKAVVVDRPDPATGSRRLVAYVVPAGEATVRDLADHLGRKLPAHMVPAAFLLLPELPLSPTGKVDRRALPEPPSDLGAAPEAAGEEPCGVIEELVAGIWADLLGLSRVSREDGFFDLGGHSLLATQAISRVREAVGVEVPLRRLFDAPTLATFSAVIAKLREGSGLEAEIRPLPGPRRSFPLSFAQERLWFLDQLDPGAALYHIPGGVRFTGRFDPAVLKAALAWLVDRHESLRTTFSSREGAAVQVVGPPFLPALPGIDLRALPAPAARERELRRLAEAHARRPFDLAAGPLLRVSLARTAEAETVALFSFHHIVSDGWSVGVFIRELGAAYGALAAGAPVPLPPLPIQYADFAVWQREHLSGATLAAEAAWWRERLAGAPMVLELIADRPRPPVPSYRGAEVELQIPAGLLAALGKLGRRTAATPFMALLAAFEAHVARTTGQLDFLVGAPVANRTQKEIEGLIGFFVNTLVLRAEVTGELRFADLLVQAREMALGAYTHQDLPFERLVEELQPARDRSRSPLVQVTLVLQNLPAAPLALPGLQVAPLPMENEVAKFDLQLGFVERGDDLLGTFVYAEDLFDRTTVERWAAQLVTLLVAAAEEPWRKLPDLPLLAATERHQLLVEWNDTATPTQEAPPHVLAAFAAVAARTPERVALLAGPSGTEVLTYGELDRRANRLARRLRAAGVTPEAPVGVCLPRSADLAAALLAVWKAGGAYLPLDPGYPRERLALLLADSGARAALTSAALAPSLPAEGLAVVAVDAPSAGDAAGPDLPPPDLGSLAYLIYTSGSTGRPKGVQVEHSNLAHLLAAARAELGWGEGETMPCVAPFSFDIFFFELLTPLLTGGTAHLVPLDPTLDVQALVETLPWATRLHAVPALMRQIAERVSAASSEGEGEPPCPGLKTLYVGGDAVPADLLADLRRAFPRAELSVLYGPTEGTILASTWRVPPGAGPEVSLLGRPLPRVRLVLQDPWGNPVPIGVPGEIWIAGAGVARGYLGREDLTAAAFPTVAGERWYRTGDLAHRLADGTLEFLGRGDSQVKIRGFRIELGEIEAALGRHPAVREAVVLAREDRPGDRRLVAYVVPQAEPPAPEELRAGLREDLPEYMVPAAFIFLEAFPLSPNGKVDRRALPAPERPATPAHRDAAADLPRTPQEEILAGIFAEVLGVDAVGTGEDFFELGGHSLLATRVVARVRQALGIELPVRALFDAPSVAELAREVERSRAGAVGVAAPPLVRRERQGEPPLSFGQERLWFLEQLEPGSVAYLMPLAVRFRGRLDSRALAASLGLLVRRHEALRTTFAEREGRPVQVIHPARPVPLPRLDLQALPATPREAELRRLAREEAGRPLPLDRPLLRLLRAALVLVAPEESVALITLHHIVSDGASMEIFVRELGSAYAALAAGEAPSLPPLPLQYADYAIWQRAWLSGVVLEGEIAWWRERLAGAPALLELPTDRPRPPAQRYRAGELPFLLVPDLNAALERQARKEGATPFMLFLAALAALLGRWSGQDDLVVGTPIANRTHREVEGLIGLFVNTLALRADLAGDPTLAKLVGRLRAFTLAAYGHQDLPFEKLVEALEPERSLAHAPVFQVLLVLQNQPRQTLRLPGLTLEPLPAAAEATKFDLTLALRATPEGLAGSWEYDRDLFDPATIARLAAGLERILATFAEDVEVRLSDLPLLSEAERQQLAEWGWGGPLAASDRCLHELFLAQAAETPDAEALVAGDMRLSYSDLAARVERLARNLAGLGVGPEVRVGVSLARTAALPVALLAVLRAGGAYVPLDPEYPQERLRLMLEDSGAALLLTQRDLADRLPDGACRRLLLTPEGTPEEDLPAAEPRRPLPGDLAYLIYTSGSTGRPKAVAIEHRSAVALASWARQAFSPAELAAVLFATSVSFDLSVFELFVPLSAGGKVIVAENALALPTLAAAGEVTLVNTVPSAMAELVRQGALPPSVRTVNLAGEPLPLPLVQALYATGTVSRVWNLYGPSEDTTYSTASREERSSDRPPAIGRPLPGTHAHVLDRTGRPVPPGVAGELHLGGAGLARGYLGRPDLTAERFVPDPSAEAAPGARLYRTGDLVRHLASGDLHFLGRIDHQVKVRGFRIELGEIEALLRRHPEVREALVLAREDRPGDRRLAAYVVPKDGAALSGDTLRAHLAGSLPEYMLPAAFLSLPALPLSPNGKVDRRALPAPEWQAETAFAPPEGPVEEVLAGMWQDVLGVSRVGRHDGFFRLGGHSLLGMELVSKVRGAFQVDLPLRRLFETPTVAALAAAIVVGEAKPGQSEKIARALLRLRRLAAERGERGDPQ